MSKDKDKLSINNYKSKGLFLIERDKKYVEEQHRTAETSTPFGTIILNKAFGTIKVYLKHCPFDLKYGDSIVIDGFRNDNRSKHDTHSGYKGLYKLPILKVKIEKEEEK